MTPPFCLLIDHLYVPLLVGCQLFGYALQAIPNEGNSINVSREKSRRKAATFPFSSSTPIRIMQGMLQVQSWIYGYMLLPSERDQKERISGKKKKNIILVSCYSVFSAYLHCPFPLTFLLSYEVCKLFERGGIFFSVLVSVLPYLFSIVLRGIFWRYLRANWKVCLSSCLQWLGKFP